MSASPTPTEVSQKSGDLASARAQCERHLAARPDDADAWRHAAQIHAALDDALTQLFAAKGPRLLEVVVD